jgi:hypothetical protein
VSAYAFAGEGSDTIGACRLMPELRYSYYKTPVVVNTHPALGDFDDDDWNVRENDATLQVTYGVTNYLDLYAFVGARIAAVKSGTVEVPGRIGTNEDRITFDLGSSFLSGVGVKGTFYRAPNGFYVGGGASFAYTFTNDDKHFKVDIGGFQVDDSGAAGIFYKETEMAATADLHAGWHFEQIGLTPYVGVEYRWVREDLEARKFGVDNDINNFTTAARNPVGVFVGVDYMPIDGLYINLEGQMIKRWGGSLSVGYAFDLCGRPTPPPLPSPEAPPIQPKLEPMSMK